ncbi:MAG: hypothetical protein AAFU53_14155 [Cyanobacteria bacterium J06632_3]
MRAGFLLTSGLSLQAHYRLHLRPFLGIEADRIKDCERTLLANQVHQIFELLQ